MKWVDIKLQVSDDEKRDALRDFHSLVYHIEGIFRLARPHINYENLKKTLTGILKKQNIPATNNEEVVFNLQHPDNEILNLPWNIAEFNGEQLQTNPKIFLLNSFDTIKKEPFKPLPQPMRILVVFSEPEDAGRLDYEAEREKLLLAFENSMEFGQMEIDFTEDATPNTIKSYLNSKPYHILHYSGHSYFNKEKQQAFLALEDDSLNYKEVAANEFAQLVKTAEYKPSLIVLSSCQSAKARTMGKEESDNYEQALSGLTNHLLAGGIPAVVGMSMSVTDKYATVFTTGFYKQLNNKQNLHIAFKKALENTKTTEYKETGQLPLQHIIPKLYVSQKTDDVIDWQARPLSIRQRQIHKFKNLIYERDEDFIFRGRRFEQKKALAELKNNKSVIITGQGGLGKTTLAEKLIYRLALTNDIETFVFRHTDNLPQDIFSRIEDFLKQNNPGKLNAVIKFLNEKKDTPEKLYILKINAYLELLKQCNKHIYFLFDNIETFLDLKKHSFKKEHRKFEEIIDIISLRFPAIITSRYPVPGKNWAEINLNTVGFFDFLQKIKQMDIFVLLHFLQHQENNEESKKFKLTSNQIIKLIYEKTAGNYRVLEMMNKLAVETFDFNILQQALDSEKDFLQKILHIDVLHEKISENLLFNELYNLLSETQKKILQILAGFNVPVSPEAIQKQTGLDVKLIETELNYLREASLCEKRLAPPNSFILNNVIKPLLEEKPKVTTFSHQKAAAYFETKKDYIQAFEHYYQAGDKENTKKTGIALSNTFFNSQDFESSLYFAQKTYSLIKEEADWNLLNRTGQNLHKLGKLNGALKFFEKAKNKVKQAGDKSGEGTTLNNISQIYYARGDYDTALKHLQESLKIARETNDKSVEITRLNNISQIYSVRGDYDTALKYLQESLIIARETDDKLGEGTVFGSIGYNYYIRSDYDMALKYLQESLKIAREIGDKSDEANRLNNISQIYDACGNYDTALEYLQESLKITREIGDKSSEGTMLNNMAINAYARGDYDTALKYLQESLKIQREIGNKSGEGSTLNNISQIYSVRGDYDTALKYLQESLNITREIGDKSNEVPRLNNISLIYKARGDYNTALKYLKESLKIVREIGDKSSEIPTLGNIGSYYYALGDYNTALKYLQESLKIARDIGNKSGEGTMLNNISQVYKSSGDYDMVLKYLKESLKIQREIGDWNGIAGSSYNMGITYIFVLDNIQEGFAYLLEAYKINKQVRNYKLEQALDSVFKELNITEEQLQKLIKQ